METTGYVLRLCPFESLSFSGATLNQEDMAAFIEVRFIYFHLSVLASIMIQIQILPQHFISI